MKRERHLTEKYRHDYDSSHANHPPLRIPESRDAGPVKLLFHGPPGAGKTTLALRVADRLVSGKPENVRVVSASIDTGVEPIRGDLASFVLERRAWKCVVLDEAERLSEPAQSVLTSLMDANDRTHYILCCNSVRPLTERLVSRLSALWFEPLPTSVVLNKLRRVNSGERMQQDDSTLSFIAENADGDMRRALVALQSRGSFDALDVAASRAKEIWLALERKGDLKEACAAADRTVAEGLPLSMVFKAFVERASGEFRGERAKRVGIKLGCLHTRLHYHKNSMVQFKGALASLSNLL